MNAKLLPEQKLLRAIGWSLLVVFGWPLWLMAVYIESDRYEKAAYDGFFEVAVATLALALQIAWVALLFWLALPSGVSG